MSRDLDALIASLTLDEKAALTAGADNWATAAVERAGIPGVRMTDGPNGARGSSVLGAGEATAVCIPCGSALGATWNPGLIERLGALLGEEALTKGCRILLAPTLNLHRSPLAGRNFECFSEDPLLAGRAAAAYVRGVQSRDVATTPKHLAGNEAELDRYTMSSVIDERALRELYLVPFELAVREGGALGVMTAYNRLNGGYCTEDEALLSGVLRDEWGFEGFVVSDWFGLASTEASPRAGLDLEMPGPAPRLRRPRWPTRSARAPWTRRSSTRCVRRLLGALDRVGALDDDPGAPGALRGSPRAPRAGARGGRRQLRAAAQRRPAPARPGSRVAGRDRPRRRPRAGHGRRLGQAARALHRRRRCRRCASACRRPTCASSAAATSTARRPSCAPAGGSRSRAPITSSERDTGLLLFDAPIGREESRFTARARVHAVRDRRAHAHAAPGRALPAVRRRRGRARRRLGSAAARRGDDRPRQRGDRGRRWS